VRVAAGVAFDVVLLLGVGVGLCMALCDGLLLAEAVDERQAPARRQLGVGRTCALVVFGADGLTSRTTAAISSNPDTRIRAEVNRWRKRSFRPPMMPSSR
jgi:hypothetical protein